ncbi:hypothetical protein [Duodenibacillus massiliensis]|uniref:hypothetical protein n=1 Tax=Duodenibacillus massiliensis TaxID=1852381 RepID=UPI002FD98FD2
MRLRWVMRRLREWAAWIDSEGQIKSPALDGMPVAAANAEAWIPKDYRLAREVHAALRKLSPDDRVTIVLVYVTGPRSNKVHLTDIADWCDLDVEVFRKRVTRAEYKVAEALDTARMRQDAANDAAKAAA